MIGYAQQVKLDKEAAVQAETDAKTPFDVKRARDDIDNAKKHVQEYKAYRDQEQRDITTIQHQINALTMTDGVEGGEDDENGESLAGNSEVAQLEDDYSSLMAKLQIYQLLSHITFNDGFVNPTAGGPPIVNASNDSNVIRGFATLTNVGDVRPFEIDLRLTPPEVIQDMIWGWLYDEHC